MSASVFADGPPVPLLVEGVLDTESLCQLFSDLAEHAEIVSIQEKGDPMGYTCPATLSLEDARERLLCQQQGRVQLRYVFDHREWIDTILASRAGYRVVRCQLSAG